MRAELITHNHDDLTVVNAARVSFGKTSSEIDDKDTRLIRYLANHRHWTPFGHARLRFSLDAYPTNVEFLAWAGDEAARAGFEWSIVDGRLEIEGSAFGWLASPPPLAASALRAISVALARQLPHSFRALMSETIAYHWSQAEAVHGYSDAVAKQLPATSKTLRLSMPIFVARQWMRSNIGVVYNETSRRYVDDMPTFWEPDAWRTRPEKGIKQGSGELASVKIQGRAGNITGYSTGTALRTYQELLELDLAPEMARTILPQSMMTELWMTATPSALRRIIALRDGTDGHPQKEIQDLAAKVVEAMADED